MFSFKLQTSCFGGLPDVTGHSNRHTIGRREPSMNIESLDSSTTCTAHQKAPLSPTREITPTPTIITNVTDLTINNKPSPADDEHKKRDSTASSDASSNRKCCWCACTSLLALVACAVAGVFVAQVLMADIYSGDRESQEQRLKLVYRILRETPLIGKCGYPSFCVLVQFFTHFYFDLLQSVNSFAFQTMLKLIVRILS